MRLKLLDVTRHRPAYLGYYQAEEPASFGGVVLDS